MNFCSSIRHWNLSRFQKPNNGNYKTSLRYMSSDILTQCSDDALGIRTITLNNPKRRNVLSLDMLKSIETNLLKENKDLKAIIIRSTGPVFSSGHDLKELSGEGSSADHEKVFELCTKVMTSLRDMPVPIIAQVQGLAAAAGCQLVASCDISIAAESSTFATPGVNSGLFCTTPGVALARAVPRKAALLMLFTGFPITSEDALKFGLVSRIVADEMLETEVRKVAEKIASLSAPVIKLGKKAFYKQIALNQDVAYQYASQVMVDNLKYEDSREGIDAFIQKRPPIWRNKDE